ncbi:MAG TPA: beta-ketoacyl-ACP synthase II [Gemmatimonadaceae bacterium]|nr:beta-ketoacyl-ACP synthase II [Gemmatimonadaceae bacterium]
MSERAPTPSQSDAGVRRAVVTGMGAITPVGNTVRESWDALLRGVSGAAPITRFDASALATRFACEVKGFDPAAHLDRKLAGRTDRYSQFALVAADEAVKDAGLSPGDMPSPERDRVGVFLGTGVGGIETFEAQALIFAKSGPRRLSPFFIPMMIPNMASGLIAMRYGFRGPGHAVSSACATGNHALADALAAIQLGHADVVLAGGSEAAVCALGIGGFDAMRALSTRNDSPQTASRPFDATRDGFVLGEGAGVLVVESLEHARRRGARIYAELCAVGAAADAYHMTAPDPEGTGVRLAMRRALDESGIPAEAVDTINMHATSTPLGDEAESAAVRRLFGAHADALVATSTKSMTGHLLGAAGAVEAIWSVLAIVHGVVPPTINVEQRDPACDISLALGAAVRRPVRVALNNAFGFGGHDTCAVFRALDA